MPSNDAQNQTMTSSYVSRLAAQQGDPASVPNYYGNQAQPTSSFDADLCAATGGAQGANVKEAYEEGGQNALTVDGTTQEQVRDYYQ